MPSILDKSQHLLEQVGKKGKRGLPFKDEGDAVRPSQFAVNSFVMNFPFSLHTGEPNNPWMKDLDPKDRKVNKNTAYQQFMDLYTYLAASSIVYLLPSVPGLQDQVYVANLGIVPATEEMEDCILAKFKSPPRRGEEEPGRRFLESLGYHVQQSPHYWEGEADLKYLTNNVYIGGYGIRTDKKAFEWMESEYDMKIVKVEMTDDYLYHFDCMLFPLDDETVMCCTELMKPADIKAVEKVAEIVPVNKDDAYMGITNGCRLGEIFLNADLLDFFKEGTEEFVMERHKHDTIYKICNQKQLEPALFELGEYTKSGALLSCLIMHLNYPDYDKGYV